METTEQIKQNLGIVDVVGSYVELKKAGRNYKGVCPFHSENTPSFMVSPELQIFKCFGCGESGDIFTFVQKIEGVDFPKALDILADKAGVKIEKRSSDPNKQKKLQIYKINETTAGFYSYLLLQHKSGKAALDYLKNDRKLNLQTIKEFKLGYAPSNWDTLHAYLTKKGFSTEDQLAAGVISQKKSGQGYIDKFRARVMFPLTGIDGKVLGFNGRALEDATPKYMNTQETLVFHKSSFIYGLDKAKISLKKEGAVFVEGQMDVLTAFQNKVTNVVASSGTALTATQLKIISRYTKDLTFCFDSDSAGVNATYRAVEIAEAQDFNISICEIPEKYSDLDEYFKEEPQKAKQFLKEPIPAYDFFITSTIKKHGKSTSIGKKKIMEELVLLFKTIKNPVTLDHYTKKIADQLDISEETVKEMLKDSKNASKFFENVSTTVNSSKSNLNPVTVNNLKKSSAEEYILALLLHADLDTQQTILYKLGKKDFTQTDLQEIFIVLKQYLLDRKKKFQIKYFSNKLPEEQKALVNELYLWDLTDVLDEDKVFAHELNSAYKRLKAATVRREMQEVSAKIKQAELENRLDDLEEYTKELKELTDKLV